MKPKKRYWVDKTYSEIFRPCWTVYSLDRAEIADFAVKSDALKFCRMKNREVKNG